MTSKGLDVVIAGHICLDMSPRFLNTEGQGVVDIFRPGVLLEMGQVAFSTGGTVSNAGIAMKIFGLNVGYMAKIGDDLIGQITLEELKKNGNTDGVKIAKGEPSSYTVALAPEGIDRILLHCPGTNNTFTSADIDYSLVGEARHFHFGYPAIMKALYQDGGEELSLIFERAKDSGATTSLDLAMPDPNAASGKANWRRILRRTLPFVDMFLPSIEEAFFALYPKEYLRRKEEHSGKELLEFIDHTEYSRIAAEYIAMGCRMVALKAGPCGWYFRTGSKADFAKLGRLRPTDESNWDSRELWSPSFSAKHIASATGAGDSSIAGFIAAMIRCRSLEECLVRANSAGWQNLTSLDALSGLKSWQQIEKNISRLKINDLPFLHDTDWQWREKSRLWERKAA
jgi:sugar/nucleoside kinase (ribokinase family)